MKPDIYNFVATLEAEYGVEAAAEVAVFEARHVHAVKDFVDKERIDCDYTVTKAIDVQLCSGHFQKLKSGYERLVSNGFEPTKPARFVNAEDAESVHICSNPPNYSLQLTAH
jgi:3',5'-cyclic AMP phosphodiesterase CpdA